MSPTKRTSPSASSRCGGSARRPGHRLPERPPRLVQVRGGEHGDHPGQVPGGAGVDAADGPAGDRAADERRVQQARHGHVVHVPAAPGQQPRVLPPPDRLARPTAPRCLLTPRPPALRAGTAPRAGPPGRCPGSRCSGRGCRSAPPGSAPRPGRGTRRRNAVTDTTNPGVQKPHCRPCSSQKACWTGPSEPGASPVSPSTVVTSRPSACTAEHQAGPDRRAVDQHRARPADAVLAGQVGAGQQEVLAQQVGERLARLRTDPARLPVHGQRHVEFGHPPPPSPAGPRASAGSAPGRSCGRPTRRR